MRAMAWWSCVVIAGCSGTSVEDAGPPDAPEIDAPMGDVPGDAGADAPPDDDAPAAVTCASNDDCPKDAFCDWSAAELCGDEGAPGRCEPRPITCPDTVATVCGCDGEDYRNPCRAREAGVAIASDGACALGAACSTESPCASGLCEHAGPAGCEVTESWSCREGVACTDDEVEWCGCDDATFSASSTCPDRPYAHEGPCDTNLVNCNLFEVLCFETPLPCPGDLVREVVGECWGQCVRLERCACTNDEACPFAPDDNVCDVESGHCIERP